VRLGSLRDFIGREVLGRVAAPLRQEDAQLRATLGGSQLVGLATARYVVRLEPLASATPETVIAAIAPTLRRYLTGRLALPIPAESATPWCAGGAHLHGASSQLDVAPNWCLCATSVPRGAGRGDRRFDRSRPARFQVGLASYPVCRPYPKGYSGS
jgi:Tetracyclin repressor-like, C-terminal domain